MHRRSQQYTINDPPYLASRMPTNTEDCQRPSSSGRHLVVNRPHSLEALSSEERRQIEEEASAYALDALEPEEARAYREHLTICAVCRLLVSVYMRSAAQIGESVEPVPADPAVRVRVLATARESTSRQRRFSPMLAVLAAAAVVIAALTGLNVQLRSELDSARRANTLQFQRLQTLNAALTTVAEGQRLVPLTPAGGGGPSPGTVIIPGEGRSPLLVANQLPAISANQVYQVWVVRGNQAISAGILQPNQGMLMLSAEIRGADTLALTVEPGPAGSQGPTSDPVIIAKL